MTTESSVVLAPSGSAAIGKSAFILALIFATLLPIIVIFTAPGHRALLFTVDIIVALNATHVFASTYLLTDPNVRRFIAHHPLLMGLAPLSIFAAGMAVFSLPVVALYAPARLLCWCGKRGISALRILASPHSSPLANVGVVCRNGKSSRSASVSFAGCSAC